MMYQKYSLAAIDGILCVVSTSADYRLPQLVANHWPTTVKARDFASFLGIEIEQIPSIELRHSYGNHAFYAVSPHRWGPNGTDLYLTDGGKTQPIHTEILPYPKPRTNRPCEYRDGYWWKNMARGWVRV